MNKPRNLSRKISLSLFRPLGRFLAAGILLAGLLASDRADAALLQATNSGNLNVATNWSPNNVPTSADSIEILTGINLTNSTLGSLKSVTIDVGGDYTVGFSETVGTITNNGTFSLGNNSSARTFSITTNFVNNGLINGNTGGANVIQFNGGILSTWIGSGDTSGGKMSVTVSATTTLDISGLTTPLKFKGNGTTACQINGTLITGTQVIDGNANSLNTFNINSGATLITANTNGITNGTVGTFNYVGAVSLNSGANYTFNGTAAQVTTGLPSSVFNLTNANSVGLTLSAATSINGTLALNGGPLTTSAAATPNVEAGLLTGSGVVNGPLAVLFFGGGSQTFPVSKGGNNRSVTLNVTGLGGSTTFTVEQFESAMGGALPPSTSEFSTRFWTISQSGPAGFTYDLTVDGTGFTPTDTAVILQQGSPDTSYSTTFASPNYTTTGLTSVGNFTLGNFAPASDMLAITTAPVSVTAGVSSGTMTVQLQTSGGTPKNTTSNLTVNLSTTSASGVFRNTADTATITSVTITTGNNSASFKYDDTLAPGTPTVTAAATGVSPATQIETVNVAGASQLSFSTQPVSTNLAQTMAPVVVQIQDAFGNNVLQSGTAVTLALNGDVFSSGTTVQNSDVNGQATFGDLVITQPGTNLTLTATATSLTAANSTQFSITSRQIIKKDVNASMDSPASWFGSIVPGPLDTAFWNNSSVAASPNNTPEFGSDATWYGIYMTNWSAAAGLIILDATGGTLTLGPGGLYGTNISHSLSMSNGFILAAPQLWNWSGSGGSMLATGGLDNGGFLLTVSGTLPMALNGAIIGTGGLTKTGANTLTLGGTNLYTGPNLVNGGILTVQGILAAGSSVTVATGATLKGTGTIADSVTVQNGGKLSLSPTIGTLTINGSLTLQPSSSTSMVIDHTSATADQVTGLASVTFGGTLTVSNLTGTPVVGEHYTLFSAASYSGNYSTIAGSPGSGLAWIFNPTNGVLTVTNGTVVNSTNITAVFSGGSLNISWPTDHLGWILQGQTNAFTVGITTNWVDIAGTGSSTNFSVIPNPAKGSAFYRLRSP